MSPKRYFLGIDSDGTVFDSMVIKHQRVFQPVAIEVWNLGSVEAQYCSIAESINLYSVHRGINRFAGLAMIFDLLAKQSDEAKVLLEGQADLQEYVHSGNALSFAALANYNQSKQSTFLDKVLEWSLRSDSLYSDIMESKGNPVYPYVRKSLERASEHADIVVISSSSRKTLEDDWAKAGLLSLVTKIEGQEQGSKTCQLREALEAGYPDGCALMMGDALSDLEAAREHGMSFFPIIPRAEEESWEQFYGVALARFFEGSYTGEYEQERLAEFEGTLVPDNEAVDFSEPVFQNS
ncbi:hypothetical protein DDZ13_11015 [Coraliomargarita sinensis]|uniref:Haloacid dehalogenase n=1 Tax=Coraliomargarita sinensis TaxID=2174842 RepID=A0A317ZHQ7_9BACT|nr:HAD hydrolase-like protein [Coraliomargarita sinensis]PXA03508.1 hypothetical protein DDZ13_11015 [Coraliomargarita sinensis]